MIKLNLAGDALPADSIDHNMVYHPDLDLYEAINSPGFEKPRTYEEAEAAIAALNKQSWGGFSDWRLPDDTEAQVPVDRTRYSPACDTSVYPDAVSDWYWTGVETTWSREEMRTGASREFFVVCMDDGYVDDAYADVRFRARPVRRGDTAMSKYTAEQVKAAAESILNSPGLEACDMGVEASMLRAYAEMLREHEQKEVMRNGRDGVSIVPAVTGGAHRANAHVVETVGFVRESENGLFIDWAIEGGIDALEPGSELLVASHKVTDEDGAGEVYTRPAERAAVPERIDIQRVPVISTRHVSGERFCWLAHKARLRAAERDNGEMPVASYGWGYWLYVPDDWVGVNTHADLSPVFEWFDGLDLGGDRWLRIDADGPVIPGLPIFEW